MESATTKKSTKDGAPPFSLTGFAHEAYLLRKSTLELREKHRKEREAYLAAQRAGSFSTAMSATTVTPKAAEPESKDINSPLSF